MGLDEGDPEAQRRFAAFRRTLAGFGWNDGDNVQILARWAAGSVDDTRKYASELIGTVPDVIVVNTPIGLTALRDSTKSIPIVFVQVLDAAESAVKSAAHPGGNITGFYSFFENKMAGKWLQLLQAASPGLKRVAVLQNPEHPAWSSYFASIQPVAASLGIQAIQAAVQTTNAIEQVIGRFSRERNDGLIVLPDSFTTAHRDLIVAAANHQQIPNIAASKSFPAAGGLMSYGADLSDLMQKAGEYVDRILKGQRAAELPVQASTTFELVLNRNAARTLGLTIPLSLLALADEVIE
jgi:putative ABC transport system substrate-binding protein